MSAINWENITGLNGGVNGSDTYYCYTYVNFAKDGSRPELIVDNNNYGTFITSDGDSEQTVNTKMRYTGTQYLGPWEINFVTSVGSIPDTLNIKREDYGQPFLTLTKVNNGYSSVYQCYDIDLTLGHNLTITRSDQSTITIDDSNNITISSGNVKLNNGYCQATYFNATSDIRVKTNITQLTASALEYVNQLKLYSFNYLGSDEVSVGVIAQEVQNINYESFNLVNQPEAADDILTVKESKLVYILAKAIQEQQSEIKKLQEEIKQLKKTL